MLLPPMKFAHDNRNRIEFDMGHRLDQLQDMLGQGNEATKRNLAEYKYISDLLKAKPADLSDKDKTLLAKHSISDNFQFNEHRESWKHVLKARATGVSMTTTLGLLFGATENFKSEKLHMSVIQEKAGELIGSKVLKKVLPASWISKPEALGKYVFLELILYRRLQARIRRHGKKTTEKTGD